MGHGGFKHRTSEQLAALKEAIVGRSKESSRDVDFFLAEIDAYKSEFADKATECSTWKCLFELTLKDVQMREDALSFAVGAFDRHSLGKVDAFQDVRKSLEKRKRELGLEL